MKRIISAFVALLLMTSCSYSSVHKPHIIPQQNSIVSVDINGIEYSANISINSNGTLNLIFNYPDDILGLEMNIDSQGFEVKFGEVKFSYPENFIDSCFKDLFNAVSDIRTHEPDTFTRDNNLLTADYGKYTVQYDTEKEYITAVSSAEYSWYFELLQ